VTNNGGNYRIEGMAAGAQSAAAVQAFLGARNTGGITTGGLDGDLHGGAG
jgi:hypothetical protein